MRERSAIGLVIGLGLGLAVALASSAEAAKSRKHNKKVAGAPAVHYRAAPPQYWGQNLVRPGPLYNGPDYLGNDPDPNIRFQLLRDLSTRYGGGEN
jgi:hypothetical protein